MARTAKYRRQSEVDTRQVEQDLDMAAKANLSARGLSRYHERKQELLSQGEDWEEIELILTGWIWDESEEESLTSD